MCIYITSFPKGFDRLLGSFILVRYETVSYGRRGTQTGTVPDPRAPSTAVAGEIICEAVIVIVIVIAASAAVVVAVVVVDARRLAWEEGQVCR